MSEITVTCPYCGGTVPENTTICPDCHEDLSSLVHLECAHLIQYNQGLAMAREGRLDEAANHLHSALEYQGSFAPAHVLLAKVRAQQQRWEEAKESISRAVALAPEDQSAKQLAAEIEQAEHEAEAERLREARERRAGAERYLSACQRDVTRAFALGAGVATALALLVSWPGGGKRRG